MRVKASVARDDASAKRRFTDAPNGPGAAAAPRVDVASKSAAATAKDELVSSRYNYSSSGGRSKLQLECSDGRVFDVTHEEAMMSSTLWMLLQDVADSKVKTMVKQHMIPIYDVPSNSVELALFYCRCLYKQQVEGQESALHAWDERFLQLDSKTLCDLAKVASHLDIQPLVDLTCRSIAQIMSATEAAHEIRQKFGLEDSPAAMECSCELRTGMSGFDFDMFNSLDHDLSTEEYELVEFDQPSVDELVSFINGGSARPGGASVLGSGKGASSVVAGKKDCFVHAASAADAASAALLAALDPAESSGAGKKKSKSKKKKKKKAASATASTAPQAAGAAASRRTQETPPGARAAKASDAKAPQQSTGSSTRNASSQRRSTAPSTSSASRAAVENDDDDIDESDETDSSDETSAQRRHASSSLPRDLQEKMRLAQQNPSAIFCESQFEEEDDEEMQAQIESFRRALESAHLDSSARAKPKPRVQFAPQDVFRSTLVASQRHTSQRVSAAI